MANGVVFATVALSIVVVALGLWLRKLKLQVRNLQEAHGLVARDLDHAQAAPVGYAEAPSGDVSAYLDNISNASPKGSESFHGNYSSEGATSTQQTHDVRQSPRIQKQSLKVSDLVLDDENVVGPPPGVILTPLADKALAERKGVPLFEQLVDSTAKDDEIARLEALTEQLRNDIDGSNAVIASLRRAKDDDREGVDREKFESELENIMLRVRQLEARNNELEKEKLLLEEAEVAALGEVDEIRSKLEVVMSEHEGAVQDMNGTVEVLRVEVGQKHSEIADLDRSLQEQNEERLRLKHQLEQLLPAHEQLRNERTKLQAALEQVKLDFAMMKKTSESQAAELKHAEEREQRSAGELRSRIGELQSDLSIQRRDSQLLSEKVASLSEEKALWQTSFDGAENQMQQLLTERDNLKSEVDRLTVALNDSESATSHLMREKKMSQHAIKEKDLKLAEAHARAERMAQAKLERDLFDRVNYSHGLGTALESLAANDILHSEGIELESWLEALLLVLQLPRSHGVDFVERVLELIGTLLEANEKLVSEALWSLKGIEILSNTLSSLVEQAHFAAAAKSAQLLIAVADQCSNNSAFTKVGNLARDLQRIVSIGTVPDARIAVRCFNVCVPSPWKQHFNSSLRGSSDKLGQTADMNDFYTFGEALLQRSNALREDSNFMLDEFSCYGKILETGIEGNSQLSSTLLRDPDRVWEDVGFPWLSAIPGFRLYGDGGERWEVPLTSREHSKFDGAMVSFTMKLLESLCSFGTARTDTSKGSEQKWWAKIMRKERSGPSLANADTPVPPECQHVVLNTLTRALGVGTTETCTQGALTGILTGSSLLLTLVEEQNELGTNTVKDILWRSIIQVENSIGLENVLKYAALDHKDLEDHLAGLSKQPIQDRVILPLYLHNCVYRSRGKEIGVPQTMRWLLDTAIASSSVDEETQIVVSHCAHRYGALKLPNFGELSSLSHKFCRIFTAYTEDVILGAASPPETSGDNDSCWENAVFLVLESGHCLLDIFEVNGRGTIDNEYFEDVVASCRDLASLSPKTCAFDSGVASQLVLTSLRIWKHVPEFLRSEELINIANSWQDVRDEIPELVSFVRDALPKLSVENKKAIDEVVKKVAADSTNHEQCLASLVELLDQPKLHSEVVSYVLSLEQSNKFFEDLCDAMIHSSSERHNIARVLIEFVNNITSIRSLLKPALGQLLQTFQQVEGVTLLAVCRLVIQVSGDDDHSLEGGSPVALAEKLIMVAHSHVKAVDLCCTCLRAAADLSQLLPPPSDGSAPSSWTVSRRLTPIDLSDETILGLTQLVLGCHGEAQYLSISFLSAAMSAINNMERLESLEVVQPIVKCLESFETSRPGPGSMLDNVAFCGLVTLRDICRRGGHGVSLVYRNGAVRGLCQVMHSLLLQTNVGRDTNPFYLLILECLDSILMARRKEAAGRIFAPAHIVDLINLASGTESDKIQGKILSLFTDFTMTIAKVAQENPKTCATACCASLTSSTNPKLLSCALSILENATKLSEKSMHEATMTIAEVVTTWFREQGGTLLSRRKEIGLVGYRIVLVHLQTLMDTLVKRVPLEIDRSYFLPLLSSWVSSSPFQPYCADLLDPSIMEWTRGESQYVAQSSGNAVGPSPPFKWQFPDKSDWIADAELHSAITGILLSILIPLDLQSTSIGGLFSWDIHRLCMANVVSLSSNTRLVEACNTEKKFLHWMCGDCNISVGDGVSVATVNKVENAVLQQLMAPLSTSHPLAAMLLTARVYKRNLTQSFERDEWKLLKIALSVISKYSADRDLGPALDFAVPHSPHTPGRHYQNTNSVAVCHGKALYWRAAKIFLDGIADRCRIVVSGDASDAEVERCKREFGLKAVNSPFVVRLTLTQSLVRSLPENLLYNDSFLSLEDLQSIVRMCLLVVEDCLKLKNPKQVPNISKSVLSDSRLVTCLDILSCLAQRNSARRILDVSSFYLRSLGPLFAMDDSLMSCLSPNGAKNVHSASDGGTVGLLRSLYARAPYLFDVEVKAKWFRLQVQAEDPPEKFVISRDSVLETAISQFASKKRNELRRKWKVQFEGEDTIDIKGVRREFVTLLSREMVNPVHRLFTKSQDGNYFPNFKSKMERTYEMIGRFMGKALLEGELLDVHLCRFVYKRILGRRLSYYDLSSIDKDLYNNQIVWVRDNDITGVLFQSFTVEGANGVDIPLCSSGEKKEVTNDNKHEYLDLLVEHKLNKELEPQLRPLISGFYDVFAGISGAVGVFHEDELEYIMCGDSHINLEDLKQNTHLKQGFTASCRTIQMFWEVLGSLEQKDLQRFLQFVTASNRVPVGGFSKLTPKFQIQRVPPPANNKELPLPSSSTCFNLLKLPAYESEAELRKKLIISIREATEGFAFS